MKDPIVEEIRYFRDEHAKKFNYDLDAICEDFKQHQQHCGHRLVRLKPGKNDLKNYTQERDQWLGQLSLDEIISEIKARRNKPTS